MSAAEHSFQTTPTEADILSAPPPGKTAADEGFPVASRFLAASVRGPVMAFYRCARAADDIADNPALRPEVKLAALDAADDALIGRPGAAPLAETAVVAAARELRTVCLSRSLPIEHARHLLQAFRKDSVENRYETWSDLLAYCNYSAAPVGRFLLDLHGEDRNARSCADALCNAHQILNHVQDCGTDYRLLDRVYLPARWLRDEGTEAAALGADACDPALRRVIDRALSGAAQLIAAARPLPGVLRNRGLRIQAAVTLAMGERLLHRLAAGDPLRTRLRLGRAAKARCVAVGLVRGLATRPSGGHG